MIPQNNESINVFNRRDAVRPRVKIGNWFEEQVLYDEYRKESTERPNKILGKTIQPTKEMYNTTNLEYGVPKKTVNSEVLREHKVSVIQEDKVNPYKTSKKFESNVLAVQTGHDLLNREPNYNSDFKTTNRTFFGDKANIQLIEKGQIQHVVTKYNPTGGSDTIFNKDSTFTKPLPLE